MDVSDKLFYWLFHNHPDRILALQRDLPAEVRGWRFSAPVIKEREHHLDGLFQPPADQLDLPTVLLKAQATSDPKVLRRLYAQSVLLLEQESAIEHWRMVVICPHRRLTLGSPTVVAEFVRERVHWLELAAADPAAPPLLRALALLVPPEQKLQASSSAVLQAEVAGMEREEAIADVIVVAIVTTRYQWPIDSGTVRHGRHHSGGVHTEPGLSADLWPGQARGPAGRRRWSGPAPAASSPRGPHPQASRWPGLAPCPWSRWSSWRRRCSLLREWQIWTLG
ncbi:MAG: DUF2887 domain-containing protein [Cyanobacteriota bacterium]|jgi:hypothetical protein